MKRCSSAGVKLIFIFWSDMVKIKYIKTWICKYILRIKSPSAICAGREYEWDLIKNGVAIKESDTDDQG